MRITHQMLTRNYLGRMNTNLKNLTGSNEKMASGRTFSKGYENVTDAGKALKIRKLVADNERYSTTIRDAKGRVAAAEDSIRGVNDLMIRAKDRLVEGLNGTMSPDDRKKIATELSKAQEEIMQVMNGQFSNKFLFAASGNENGKQPFTKDDNGLLLYNGTPVDSMIDHPINGKPAWDDGNGTIKNIPWNTNNYVDIGAGYRLTEDGRIDPNTAFKDTFSGVECFGYGTNDDGVPINAYSLFGRMVENLNTNNMDKLGEALDAIDDSMEFMLTAITDVGSRAVVLDDTLGRLETEYVNLLDTQNELEGVDLSREIINNKDYEMSWLVTLQLGSKILPQTIFDFIR